MKGSSLTHCGPVGEALSTRRNSLNFLRLVFALAVIVSHAAGFGPLTDQWESFNGTSLGTIAVAGFFGISGYLIAKSAVQNSPGRYLWQRFLRIFPGFWVCLIVTAFVIGSIGWLSVPHPCSQVSCYLHASDSPWGYLYRNWFLKINQSSIAGMPRGHYDPLLWGEWNGSLWTLFYEFLCYLMLVTLAVAGLLKRRSFVLGMTIALFISTAIITWDSSLSTHFSETQNWILLNFLRFAAVFLTGSVVYLYRERVPDSGWLALVLGFAFVGSLWLPNDGHLPRVAFTPSSFFAPLMVYPVLWLGAHLPLRSVGARNDYSYGFYIYAYPVQQLLAIWGALRFGTVVFAGLAVIATAPLAVTSWWLVERHALVLRSLGQRSPAELGPIPATEGTEA